MSESILRSTVKTFSYRLLGSGVTFIISYLFTGEVIISAGISATEFVLKPMMYWFHERFWNRIQWGRSQDKSSTV
jgi:uncharacterized membrane protein